MPAEPMVESPSPKGDVLWLCCCTSAEVAVSVILNRYSAQMPLLAVCGICAIPVLLLIVVIVRHEKKRGRIRHNFAQHPVSISLLTLIFVPFFGCSTAILLRRIREEHKTAATPPVPPSAPSPGRPLNGETSKLSTPAPPKLKHESERRPDDGRVVAPRSTQPTYQQECHDCAQAQGPNSHAEFNQYGAPKLTMSDEQRNAVRDAMSPFAGIEVDVTLNNATEDSFAYGLQLIKALNDAGLKAHRSPTATIITTQPLPPGIVFEAVGDDVRPAAMALAAVLKQLGLISKPVPTASSDVKARFFIVVSPNR